MSKRLFVRMTESGDPAIYCGGPDIEQAKAGLACILDNEVYEVFQDGEPVSIELSVRDMTDEEVADLPEL